MSRERKNEFLFTEKCSHVLFPLTEPQLLLSLQMCMLSKSSENWFSTDRWLHKKHRLPKNFPPFLILRIAVITENSVFKIIILLFAVSKIER